MLHRSVAILACAAFLAGTVAAGAQTTTGAVPDPADSPPAASGRSKAPRPAQSILLTNATTNTATQVIITGDEVKTVKLSKPLAPKARATLKLPKLEGCTVSVSAVFEGEGQVDVGDFDICRDRTIRFTE